VFACVGLLMAAVYVAVKHEDVAKDTEFSVKGILELFFRSEEP
jgi:hypothetical protein